MIKVVFIGSNGMLARDLIPQFSRTDNYCFDKPDIDITDKKSVDAILFHIRPDFVVNCAAITQVDACETDPTCYLVNGVGVYHLANACRKIKARLIHISTDYVFDGKKVDGFYKENDGKNPINHYGRSKLMGELALTSFGDDLQYLMLRVQWLFGVHGMSFVRKMMAIAEKKPPVIKVVSDQFGRPTNTVFLSKAIHYLAMNGASGVFNLGSTGHCSWYDLASETMRVVNKDIVVQPCTSLDFPTAAERPKNAVLDITKSLFADAPVMPWQDHLECFLDYGR